MIFNFRKLLGKIKEKYPTNAEFCKEMSISEKAFSDKINSKRDFKIKEIIKMMELLNIEKEDIPVYFFDYNVQEIEQKN